MSFERMFVRACVCISVDSFFRGTDFSVLEEIYVTSSILLFLKETYAFQPSGEKLSLMKFKMQHLNEIRNERCKEIIG